MVVAKYYDGDETKIPSVEFIGGLPSRIPTEVCLPGVEVTMHESLTTYKMHSPVPDPHQWLEKLAGPSASWLRAFLTSPIVVQGTAYVDNPNRRVFVPRIGQTVTIQHDNDVPLTLTVHGGARSFGPHNPDFKALELTYDLSLRTISLTIFEERRGSSIPLLFKFHYRPEQGYAPIHEVVDGRNKRIKAFYWKLWFGDETELPDIDLRDNFIGPEVVVESSIVERFCSIVGNQGESFTSVRNTDVKAPMDFAIVTGWQVSIL
jgi:fatty acid synthase subunit alpha, fungi type/fatty acid synthase subunit beta, fungi type